MNQHPSAAGVPVGPGSMLAGRYVLGTVLGRGGAADVYRAEDRLLSREVAVKVLREVTENPNDRARFVAEARTLANLGHRGLVTVLDAGISDAQLEQPFLVMELVDGQTLSARIAAGPSDLAEIGRVAVQLADAIAYAHERDVVHRDVKPGNVLLNDAGVVKLADFGIARLIGDTVRHTQTGHAVGTAAYLSPEQVLGEPLTTAVDVYSLGLVLLEMFTCERAFTGSPTEAALARLSRQPSIPDDIPPHWSSLLRDMTTRDPAARPDASWLAARLRDLPLVPPPAAPPPAAPSSAAPPRAAASPSPPAVNPVVPSAAGPAPTAVLTDLVGTPAPAPSQAPGPTRAAAPLAGMIDRAVRRAQALEREQIVLAAVALVFLLLLVAAALAA
ncbi:MAG: serine/threonine-protein kinase [Nocardioides sp.]